MKFFALLTTLFISFSVYAATPYKTEGVTLMQPDFVFTGRLLAAESLSGYVQAVQAAATDTLAKESPYPTAGYLVLAIRPGNQAMVWLDFDPALPGPVAAKLQAAILAVPAIDVRGGPVVFALNASLWDAPVVPGYPSPREWDAAAVGQTEPLEFDELIEKVWPAENP